MNRHPGWQTRESRGLRYYQLVPPELTGTNVPSDGTVVQGVFTRTGGVSCGSWSSLNVGHATGDDPRAVEINHGRVCDALGIQRQALTSAHQVHGDHVARVEAEDRGRVFPDTDGLLTDARDIILVLRFADCVPLLFLDPDRPAVGLAHAGWRGTLAGIAGRMVADMGAAFGSRPERLIVGIGPAIGPCCYQVGAEVAGQFSLRFPLWPDIILAPEPSSGAWAGARPHLDLWRANQHQLEDAGVETIALAGRCTVCHQDEFFSYRAACQSGSQPSGETGRFPALIGLRG